MFSSDVEDAETRESGNEIRTDNENSSHVDTSTNENDVAIPIEEDPLSAIRLQGRPLGRPAFLRRRRSSLLLVKIEDVDGLDANQSQSRRIRKRPDWPRTSPTIPQARVRDHVFQ